MQKLNQTSRCNAEPAGGRHRDRFFGSGVCRGQGLSRLRFGGSSSASTRSAIMNAFDFMKFRAPKLQGGRTFRRKPAFQSVRSRADRGHIGTVRTNSMPQFGLPTSRLKRTSISSSDDRGGTPGGPSRDACEPGIRASRPDAAKARAGGDVAGDRRFFAMVLFVSFPRSCSSTECNSSLCLMARRRPRPAPHHPQEFDRFDGPERCSSTV